MVRMERREMSLETSERREPREDSSETREDSERRERERDGSIAFIRRNRHNFWEGKKTCIYQ